MTALYTLTNIRKRFGEREVLSIDSLRLEPSIIYGLLGPNGAGKTTLMRILSFMEPPTEGEIRFQGQIARPDQAARFRSRVVWVPQSPVMFTGSLLYNIEYPMRLKGIHSAARRKTALNLLETVNLAHLAKAPAQSLSGGEAQRGSIARALAAGAEVILFDEPTASVDYRSRGELVRVILDLRRVRKLSLIVTTHDAALAAELCTEHIALLDGRIVPHYRPEENAAARLVLTPQGLWLALPARISAASLPPACATVAGLEEHTDHTRLRLVPAGEKTLNIYLSDPPSRELARTLSLGNTVRLRSEPE